MLRRFFLCVLLGSFFSCKHEEIIIVHPPTAFELLTSKKWKLWEIINKGSYHIKNGVYYKTNTMDQCSVDNFYTFNTQNEYVFHDAGVKCDPVRDVKGYFNYAVDGQVITINSVSYTIKVLNSSTLTFGDYSGTSPDEFTYKAFE